MQKFVSHLEERMDQLTEAFEQFTAYAVSNQCMNCVGNTVRAGQ